MPPFSTPRKYQKTVREWRKGALGTNVLIFPLKAKIAIPYKPIGFYVYESNFALWRVTRNFENNLMVL